MDSSCSSYVREDELSISVLQAAKPKHFNYLSNSTYRHVISANLFSPEAKFMNVQFRLGSGHNPEVSVYNIYIKNQFQTTFAQGRVGGENPIVAVPIRRLRPRIRPQFCGMPWNMYSTCNDKC
jgi:hypothetical protein